MVAGELGKGFVETHDVARQPHALGAERCAQQPEGGLAHCRCHLLKAHSLALVKVLVHSFAPLGVVDREQDLAPLLCRQRGEKFFRRLAHRRGRNFGQFDRNNPSATLPSVEIPLKASASPSRSLSSDTFRKRARVSSAVCAKPSLARIDAAIIGSEIHAGRWARRRHSSPAFALLVDGLRYKR